MTRLPSQAPSSTCRPRRRSRGRRRRTGVVAEPGFSLVAPGSGVIMMPPVSVCHQVSTIGQRSLADDAMVPFPGFRIDRLADRAEQAQRGAARLLHRLLARAHQRADRGRGGIEDIDLVLVDHFPEAGDRRGSSECPRTSASSRRWRAGHRRCSCGPSPSRRRRCTNRRRPRDNRRHIDASSRRRRDSRRSCAPRPWACRSSRRCRG